MSFNTPIKIQSCSKKETFLDNTQNNTLLNNRRIKKRVISISLLLKVIEKTSPSGLKNTYFFSNDVVVEKKLVFVGS